MKTQKQFPEHLKCPICGTNKSAKTLLVPAIDTNNGVIYGSMPVHKKCVLDKLIFDPTTKVFFCVVTKVRKNHGKKG